jgi:hypothetical protein
MGDLRLKSKVIQMNNVDKGKSQLRTIEIQNSGKTNLKPVIENLPSYLNATVQPEVLKPNEEGTITFTFNSRNTNQCSGNRGTWKRGLPLSSSRYGFACGGERNPMEQALQR